MTVFNLKMSKENSVTAICWLYYEEYTYYHHFQALQAHGDILIPSYQVNY